MKLQWILWIAILSVLSSCATEPAPDPPRRPNILLVVTDDQGHWACGPCGDTELQTPTMDFLAESGTWFANASSPSPVCSPARASLLTGRLPSQHGIHDFLSETGTNERTRLGEVLDGYFGRYEDQNKTGTRIMEQPPANGREPWTRMAESLSAPE